MIAPTSPAVHALWVDGRPGPLEHACFASFAETGHRVRLHVYDDPGPLPAHVEAVDARAVLPSSAIVRHRATGSVSLFSNRFRYALLREVGGTWIDCDVLCLRPLPDDAFLFARQDARRVNGAVLRIPAAHPVLRDLSSVFEDRAFVPPWARTWRRVRWTLRRRVDRAFGIEDMPWGTAGPDALTHFLGRHELLGKARPPESFYPVPYGEADRFLEADAWTVARAVHAETYAIHLWKQLLGRAPGAPPKGSFVRAVLDGAWRDVLGGTADARRAAPPGDVRLGS